MTDRKFAYQDSLYDFPYHYLPSLEGSVPRVHRHLAWGIDYLTYMSFVIDHVQKLQPDSLCDVGCGDGRLVSLVKHIVPSVTGIDVSERATAFAKAFNPGVEIVCGKVSSLQREYEMITLIEVLEHIPDPEINGFLTEVSRAMSSAGHLLLTVPSINVPLNDKHYRHYSIESLERTLFPRFEIRDHWWLYRQSVVERVTRKLLCNRFYVLNYTTVLRLIWKLHRRYTFYADSQTGTHLVCLAKRV